MADWVDKYYASKLIGSGELYRIFREYDAGRVSRNYMLGLLNMTPDEFDSISKNLRHLRQLYAPASADG